MVATVAVVDVARFVLGAPRAGRLAEPARRVAALLLREPLAALMRRPRLWADETGIRCLAYVEDRRRDSAWSAPRIRP
ncbi:hypothetical protein GCM10010404_93600 [Nonomuraea africana]|uniref:Uncharacterized protein n=1 Tax=Nonomuraea africana TaxID=46171 RepID=A0ABR9K5Z8_9ACTN|nr:hypothetical protein [Nonomuraea africana]MBE1557438.1 hypothetical protein [Nonomuraea africana]